MRLLSDEWLEALDDAAKDVAVDPDTTIIIEQTVSGTQPDVIWHTVIANGTISVVPGPARDPDVRLSCDRPTAGAVSTGRLSAQRAFLDGRLHLVGDVGALIDARPGLDVLADVFAAVRAGLRPT